MKTSPNFNETVKIAEISNCPVVISGGVSSINDIKKAKDLDNKKIDGIIVGKAIYDGDIKLDKLAKEIDKNGCKIIHDQTQNKKRRKTWFF